MRIFKEVTAFMITEFKIKSTNFTLIIKNKMKVILQIMSQYLNPKKLALINRFLKNFPLIMKMMKIWENFTMKIRIRSNETAFKLKSMINQIKNKKDKAK